MATQSHLVSSSSIDLLNGSARTFIATGTLSASFSSVPVDVGNIVGYSVTVRTGGTTLTGSVGLYASNDMVPDTGTGLPAPENWTLIQDQVGGVSARQAMSGTMMVTFNLQAQYYRWMQVQWSHTSGTGSIDVTYSGKGFGRI